MDELRVSDSRAPGHHREHGCRSGCAVFVILAGDAGEDHTASIEF
jgi:hypothetical protein